MIASQMMKRRLLKDSIFKQLMTVGGLSVIVAISVIFFFLLSVVLPVFTPADLGKPQAYSSQTVDAGKLLGMDSNEGKEVSSFIFESGKVVFRDFETGQELSTLNLPIPSGTTITAIGRGDKETGIWGVGLSDGSVLVFKQNFAVTYPNDVKTVTPGLEFPLGQATIKVSDGPVRLVSPQVDDPNAAVAVVDRSGGLYLASFETTTNLITQETSVSTSIKRLGVAPEKTSHLFLNVRLNDIYLLDGQRSVVHYRLLGAGDNPTPVTLALWPEGGQTTAAALLSGGQSLIVASGKGEIVQWFNVRNASGGFDLTRIREFPSMPAGIVSISAETYRKGFAVGDSSGNIGLYYATSKRQLEVSKVASAPVSRLEFAPRGNAMLFEAGGSLSQLAISNDYPEVSFSSLWTPVWYESYEKPEFIWQSTAATDDFEPKLSLAPLTFGTLKAAFYAMLLSIPLAIGAAICSAYFMAPKMRQIVKPSVEIMEALPTVILGFLAGLWLAPLVEANLTSTLLLFVMIPLFVVLAAWVWEYLPESLTRKVPQGWESLMLVPVCILAIWFSFLFGKPIEAILFAGDLPHYLSTELGIKYEQRNSLVVGIAMGFAVTPTIYSIAEDAIFSVPKHLTSGSLALGATPWQTLTNVVLLTASPGIFSAVMIGLGRAVGETMIVLMATGNTAVMDMNIFEGFRTLSANIGVEMPEAAVGTTHYRLLFLSALVLFVFTFCVNTIAELIRHRLREKYSSL